MTSDDIVLHQNVLGRLGGEALAVAEAFESEVVKAAQAVRGFPQRVIVRHAEVAAELAPLLVAQGVEVGVDPTPPGIESLSRHLIEAFGGYAIWPPVGRSETWRGWELPKGLVDDCFDAAARFYERAPWRTVSNIQAPRASFPSGREWAVCVLGNAGEAFGLALYSDTADLTRVFATQTPTDGFDGMRGRMVALGFESLTSMSEAARKELSLTRRRIVGPAAFPDLMTSNTPGGGISVEDVRDLVSLLVAIPEFVAEHAAELEEEEATDAPCEPIEWTDPGSGVVLRYAGELRSEAHRAGFFTDAFDAPFDTPSDLPLELEGILEHVDLELGPDATDEEFLERANQRLQAGVGAYNTTGQAEMGGLSPAQVERLLDSDWLRTDGALELSTVLTEADLADSETLPCAREMLRLADELEGLGRTQTGNLKVAHVREIMARTSHKTTWGAWLDTGATRRVREQDVWPVHEARVLCDLANLLHPRKTRFVLTREGRRLLDPAHLGELFAVLFETCFRRFNMFYGGYAEWPELQYQVAFTLCRLEHLAGGWCRTDELVKEAVLPFALDHAPAGPVVDAGWTFERHVLDRLTGFGLMERRATPGRSEREYRVTPLFPRFLRFDV